MPLKKTSMIPKIIHYCWFGHGPKPPFVDRCISSWHKHLPDYKIVEWNTNNFDYNYCPYSREAYQMDKFAFVSDVARAYVLYHHGGIYLDTDVEIFKSFDHLLDHRSFWGFEAGKYIATSTIGAEKENELIKEYIGQYAGRRFLQSDGSLDLTTNVSIVTNILQQRGLILNDAQQVIGDDNIIYPQRYFSPYDSRTGVLSIHLDTIAVHYYSNTWNSTRWFRLKRMFKNFIAKIVGEKLSKALWLGEKCEP
jgi:hypothetical protein